MEFNTPPHYKLINFQIHYFKAHMKKTELGGENAKVARL